MHPIDVICARLRAAGYHPAGAWCAGSTWVVRVSGAGHTFEATGQTQRGACQRALRTVESLGIVVPAAEDDRLP
jgi:hypothetical protein